MNYMNDEELIEYVKSEFVDSGFITVHQWRNFIDYLQILINKEVEEAKRRRPNGIK